MSMNYNIYWKSRFWHGTDNLFGYANEIEYTLFNDLVF